MTFDWSSSLLLIIEGLKIYGFDIFYLPRTLVNQDLILGEDIKYLLSIFKDSLMNINEDIKILLPNKTEIYGKFKDINNDGSLILESNGISKNIYNGRIKL